MTTHTIEMLDNLTDDQLADAFARVEHSTGAELTNRLIPGDEGFDYPEWSEHGEIDGVPVVIYYRTTPEDQTAAEETGDWGSIDWADRLDRIEVDWTRAKS